MASFYKLLFILIILCGSSSATVIKLISGSVVTAKPPNANLSPMLKALTELKLNLIKENSQAVIQGQTANAEDPKEVISANFPEKKINVMSSLINSQNSNRTNPKISTETKYVVLNPSNNKIKQIRRKKTNRKPRRKSSTAKKFEATTVHEEKHLPTTLQTTEQTTPIKTVTLQPKPTPTQATATSILPLAKSSAPNEIEKPKLESDIEMTDSIQIPVIVAPPSFPLYSPSLKQQYQSLPDVPDYLGDSQEMSAEENVPNDIGMIFSYITKVNDQYTESDGSDYVIGEDVDSISESSDNERPVIPSISSKYMDPGYVPTFTEQQTLSFVPHAIAELRNGNVDPNNEDMAHMFGDLWELIVEESERDEDFERMSPILETILSSNKPKHPRTRYTRSTDTKKDIFKQQGKLLWKKLNGEDVKPKMIPITAAKGKDQEVSHLGKDDKKDEDEDYYAHDDPIVTPKKSIDPWINELIKLNAALELIKKRQAQVLRPRTDVEEQEDYFDEDVDDEDDTTSEK